jgi:hypothetical protein
MCEAIHEEIPEPVIRREFLDRRSCCRLIERLGG